MIDSLSLTTECTTARKKLFNVRIFPAIGVTIDFEVGYKLRSPKWMSEVELE
ncbi:MAG: hypothetical protein ACQZ3N_03595 [cyanobacterium endosymbiont of Rhopalodia yunnanensis]